MKVKESPGKSLFTGKLPRGCQLCVQGKKAVVFLGGTCSRPDHCSWYCPISKERRGKDALFIDEMPLEGNNDVLEEIDAIDAKGISFTGGDPAVFSFEKVIEILKLVKERKGKNFHVHLYTTGIGLTREKLEILGKNGLDEIRFHPPIDSLDIIKDAIVHVNDVGVEIPAIPTEEYISYAKTLIRFLEKVGGKFVNLNEFEFSEMNAGALKQNGFILKEGTMAAVEGSLESALDLMDWYVEEGRGNLSIHFCPIITKDEYQLRNRYLRRAKNTRKPFELLTREGTVLFGRFDCKDKDECSRFVEDIRKAFKQGEGMIQVNSAPASVYFSPKLLKKKQFRSFVFKEGFDGQIGLVETLPLSRREDFECEYTPFTTRSTR
ncbi:MAG: radical SAM protein [Promethearchaeota archaeon]